MCANIFATFLAHYSPKVSHYFPLHWDFLSWHMCIFYQSTMLFPRCVPCAKLSTARTCPTSPTFWPPSSSSASWYISKASEWTFPSSLLVTVASTLHTPSSCSTLLTFPSSCSQHLYPTSIFSHRFVLAYSFVFWVCRFDLICYVF